MDIRYVVNTKKLDAAISHLAGQALSNIVKQSAFRVEAIAKTMCPVDTGATRASIFTAIDGHGMDTVARVGPTTYYAPYLEFGTSRMAARPFLRPALDQVRKDLESAVQDVIRRELT